MNCALFFALLFTLALTLATTALAGAGFLGPDDDRLASGEYFDRVSFTGTAGDEVVIEVTSTDFDPYVILIDAAENPIVQQDDGPGVGLNVLLHVTLPTTGDFTVIVTSALPGETGGYRLTVAAPGQSAAAPSTPGKALPGASAVPASPSQAAAPPAPPTPPAPPAPPEAPNVPTQPTQPTRPRTVSGRAVDTQGRPIADARVWIVPSLTSGVVEVRTDADGYYLAEDLLDVPYRARAWTFVEHNGARLCLRLGMESAAAYDSFSASMGAESNFVMQLSGPIGDLRDTQEQFGGVLSVYNQWYYEQPGNSIEFTFTPTGPLIDGSTIEPFTRTIDPAGDSIIRGLPLGPYQVGAVLVEADGARRSLTVSTDGYSEFQPAMPLDWTGDGTCSMTSGADWEYIYLQEQVD